MTGEARENLDAEFQAFEASRLRVRCTTCKLDPDLRAWVEAKVTGGSSMASVCAFLNLKGVAVTPSAIKNHFTGNHHVDRR